MKLFRSVDYKDKRGVIMNATPTNPHIRNVMYITGKKGAVRGSHVHKEDSHYCLVVKGKISYFWQRSSGLKDNIDLNVGDIVLSEPGEIHKFEFLTDGVFIAMATKPRTEEDYEEDTTRVEF